MDLIKEYVSFIEEQLDAPKEFIEASGYYLVSAILGKFFHCASLPGGKLGAKPNVWFILSSIPGRTRRSTVSNYCQFVYKNALIKFFGAKLKMSLDDSKKRTYNTIIEEGTPEGIVDHIQLTELDTYTLVSTEFGSVLQRMGTKDYELGVSTLYSKLYYGEGHSMMLSQKGKEARNRFLKSGLYVTMFCGMQEAGEYITRTMSRQGLLRRLILVACYPKEIVRWKKPLDRMRQDVYGELWTVVDEFVKKALQITEKLETSSLETFDMVFAPDAENIVNKYARKHDKALESNFGVTDANIYMQSFWEHLAKLSMLRAISRNSFKLERNGDSVGWIEKVDVEEALDFLNRATKHNRQIISNLEESDEKIRTSKHPLERIFELIDSDTKGIPRSELFRKTGMTKRLLDSYLDTLFAQERIELKTVSSGKRGGRAKAMYFSKN